MDISEEYRHYLIERNEGLCNVIKSINKLVTHPSDNDFYEERNIGTLEFAVDKFIRKTTSIDMFEEGSKLDTNSLMHQIAQLQMVIARDHIFGEGNKRTSFLTCGLLMEFFVKRRLEPEYTEEIEEFIVRVAGIDREDHIDDVEVVIDWLNNNSSTFDDEEGEISIPHSMGMIDRMLSYEPEDD